jgi:hypothetical protein
MRSREDRIPDAFDIFQHFIVPEAEHAVAMLQKPSIARGIAAVVGVLASIDLNHEPFLSAGKVNNIRPAAPGART